MVAGNLRSAGHKSRGEVNGYGHGDPRSPGKATDLHKTRLDRGQLTEVITCRRPGSEMPHFDKYAYELRCCDLLLQDKGAFDGMWPPLQVRRSGCARHGFCARRFFALQRAARPRYSPTFGGPDIAVHNNNPAVV